MRPVAGQPVISPGYGWAAVLDEVQDVKHAPECGLHIDKAVGRCRRGSRGRRTTTGLVTAAGAAAFDQDGRQHAKAVAEGVQVAHPMDPGMLETRNLGDAESFRRYPHMDQRLDLEAVAPQPPVALA
jgi:hypothetical protein